MVQKICCRRFHVKAWTQNTDVEHMNRSQVTKETVMRTQQRSLWRYGEVDGSWESSVTNPSGGEKSCGKNCFDGTSPKLIKEPDGVKISLHEEKDKHCHL